MCSTTWATYVFITIKCYSIDDHINKVYFTKSSVSKMQKQKGRGFDEWKTLHIY